MLNHSDPLYMRDSKPLLQAGDIASKLAYVHGRIAYFEMQGAIEMRMSLTFARWAQQEKPHRSELFDSDAARAAHRASACFDRARRIKHALHMRGADVCIKHLC